MSCLLAHVHGGHDGTPADELLIQEFEDEQTEDLLRASLAAKMGICQAGQCVAAEIVAQAAVCAVNRLLDESFEFMS